MRNAARGVPIPSVLGMRSPTWLEPGSPTARDRKPVLPFYRLHHTLPSALPVCPFFVCTKLWSALCSWAAQPVYLREPIDMPFQCQVCNKFVPTAQGLKSHITRLHKDHPQDKDVRCNTSDPEASNTPDPEQFDPEEFVLYLASLRASTKIIRRLPKAARPASSYALSGIIDHVVNENSVAAWKTLFLFPNACFVLPPVKQNEPHVSLATWVTRNVNAYRHNRLSPVALAAHPTTKAALRPSCEDVPLHLIESKVSEGDIKGAIRILCSDTALAPFNDDTLSKLRALHPQTPRDSVSAPQTSPTLHTSQTPPPFPIEAGGVKKAITSFLTGSAGGLDRFLPQHFKDLTGYSSGPAGVRLLSSLVNLCSLIAKGLVPAPIRPIICGASLCALSKKDGGVRPISIGFFFRRLVAKLGSTHIFSKLGSFLAPDQFGYGVKGGAEAVAHATRRFASYPHPTPKVLLKLDFSNAFNSIHREKILSEAATHIPDLLPFLNLCYLKPSLLSFGSAPIISCQGIQQGDPLGPALFRLAVKSLSSLRSKLNLWFLDDVTLGGSLDDVTHDFNTISRESNNLGLSLNIAKCELLPLGTSPLSEADCSSKCPSASSFRFPHTDEWVILGAPITDTAISKCLDTKIEDLTRLVDKLQRISSHFAFFLLKNALSIPKLLYVIRCAPSWKASTYLERYDSLILQGLESTLNISLSETSTTQVFLPVAEGGMGLRQASALAIPAFLASASSVSTLLEAILPPQVAAYPDVPFEEGLARWSSHTGHPLPPPASRAAQSTWEQGLFSLAKASLQTSATSLIDKARLLGISSKESGAFLQALPSPQLGTFLEDNAFRIAISLRLGTDICEPHVCPCGATVTRKGLHGLSCKRSPGRTSRHTEVNDLLKRALSSAGFPSSLEPASLSPDTNLRPDGVTLAPWYGGKNLAWDFTCVDGQAHSYLDSSAGIHLHAASRAESIKRQKYISLTRNYIFAPIAAECLGGFGRESLQILKTIGKKMNNNTGEKRASEFFFQRLSVAIQRGNAASILGSMPRQDPLEEVCQINDL